jgi:ATP-dependent DNA ligase
MHPDPGLAASCGPLWQAVLAQVHIGPMLFRPSPAAQRRPPGFTEPCIPTLASRPPVGPQWVHEIKHDGYRLITRKTGDRVRLFTRRGYERSDRYPQISKALAALRASSATIDGEAVCCDVTGLSALYPQGRAKVWPRCLGDSLGPRGDLPHD